MKTDDTMIEQVLDALRPLVPQDLDLAPDTDLVADLNLDSLKVMKILETLEDRLDISIPISILPEVRTVDDLALQIRKLDGRETHESV